MEQGKISAVQFDGEGCAISTASSDLMSEVLRGKTIQDAKDIFHGFHELVAGDGTAESVPKKLAVFSGVREFPMRVKCATLAWHTLIAAIEGNKEASTE